MKSQTIYLIFISMLLMAGCREAAPTPAAPETAVVAAVTPTIAPTETATARPTNTPLPTDTPEPTFTFTPSATPLPLLVVSVQDKADETFLPDGRILLDNADLTFHAEQSVNADGQATFADLVVGETYTVTVQADGYLDAVLPVEFAAGGSELEVGLEAGTFVTVTGEDASLRSGPGTVYGRIGTIETGAVLQVVGRDESGDWLLVLTADGEEAWLAASLVDVEGVDMAAVTAVAAPATPTPAPTTVAAVPVSQPPPAAPPSGQNLLVNPGFENGTIGWDIRSDSEIYQFDIFPNMVHSGQGALRLRGRRYQLITGLTVDTTYRFGAWARIWSGNGEERGVSDAPGQAIVRVCLNTNGDTNPDLPTTVCSNWVSPIDVWQYITVDAVATTDRMAAMMFFAYSGENAPNHNESAWDDAQFGVAPIAATATPAPAGPPVRPAPVPFDAVALRDNMSQVEYVLNQMGGLLDRLIRGSWETCQEYEGYYSQLMTSATYHSLPDEWNGIYNEYIFAVENATSRNNGVFSLCQNGGGSLTSQSYGDARSSISDSLDRLIPAVQQANALLGG